MEDQQGPAGEEARVIFIGIDCGKLGAVAWMDGERKVIEVHDTPLFADGDFDLLKAWALLQTATWNISEVSVVIEDTISVPHVSSKGPRFIPASDKTLHFSLGAWCGLCASLRLPVTLVHPRTWKASVLAGVANDKATEALVLQQRFQGRIHQRVLHGPGGGLRDGRVDALWLAEYGRTQWKFRPHKSTPAAI